MKKLGNKILIIIIGAGGVIGIFFFFGIHDPLPPVDLKVYSTLYSIGFEVEGDDSVNVTIQKGDGDIKNVILYQSNYKCEWHDQCDTTKTFIKKSGSAMFLDRGTQYNITVNDSAFTFSTLDSMILEAKDRPAQIGSFNAPGYYNMGGDTLPFIQINSDSVHVDNFVVVGGRKEGVRGAGYNDIIISRGRIIDFGWAIIVGGVRWWIVNNKISGQMVGFEQREDYLGILTDTMNTITIENNEIYHVGDGIKMAYGGRIGGRYNIDVVGNYIHDVADDGIEADGAHSNIRMWNNRIIKAGKHGASAQPQGSGVWYIINNYMEGIEMNAALKLYAVDNMVITGNTFINEGVSNEHTSDVAAMRDVHNLRNSVFENNYLEYKGEVRGPGLTSYVYYSNKGGFDIPPSNTNVYPDTIGFKLKNW